MNQLEYNAWREAFRRDHGFYPEEDPNLAEKGFSQEQALAEHLQVLNWAQNLGKPAVQEDYERYWNDRYGGPPLAAGRGGRPSPSPSPGPSPSPRPSFPRKYQPWKNTTLDYMAPLPARSGRFLMDFLNRYRQYYSNTTPMR